MLADRLRSLQLNEDEVRVALGLWPMQLHSVQLPSLVGSSNGAR